MEIVDWNSIIAAFLGGGLFIALAEFTKSRAFARKSDFENALALIESLQQENERLRREIKEMRLDYEQRIIKLVEEVTRLKTLMMTCNIDPDNPQLIQQRRKL